MILITSSNPPSCFFVTFVSTSASFWSSSMSKCILSSTFASPPLTYPSIFPPPIFSNTPPSFPNPLVFVPSTEASDISRPSHSYNLHSLDKSSSQDVCGIGIIPPPKISKTTCGRHSTIYKVIHQAGIDMTEGIQLSTDWVLREQSTLSSSPDEVVIP